MPEDARALPTGCLPSGSPSKMSSACGSSWAARPWRCRPMAVRGASSQRSTCAAAAQRSVRFLTHRQVLTTLAPLLLCSPLAECSQMWLHERPCRNHEHRLSVACWRPGLRMSASHEQHVVLSACTRSCGGGLHRNRWARGVRAGGGGQGRLHKRAAHYWIHCSAPKDARKACFVCSSSTCVPCCSSCNCNRESEL